MPSRVKRMSHQILIGIMIATTHPTMSRGTDEFVQRETDFVRIVREQFLFLPVLQRDPNLRQRIEKCRRESGNAGFHNLVGGASALTESVEHPAMRVMNPADLSIG
jgi:hypothetical protein